MKLSQLLATRLLVNRQATLANLAYAYLTLAQFADRVDGARLRGRVRLHCGGTGDEPGWAALTALDGSQSVIEEHFDDDEILELADAIATALDADFTDLVFPLEKLRTRFAAPLRRRLDRAGITIDLDGGRPAIGSGLDC
jgi:hypothetical protein